MSHEDGGPGDVAALHPALSQAPRVSCRRLDAPEPC